MTQTAAIQSIAEELGRLQDGQTQTLAGAAFREAFESPASAAAAFLGFAKPIITAETGFKMRYPGWLCDFNRAHDAYTVTKPRRNPYAAQHGNH